jgi:stress response protein YsnF/sporulation protein YlmC with PRC-barrel domain
MTMQAEQLIGVRVTGGDGQVVGTVQQVFNDDRDGTPVWARIRAGNRDRFVPLSGSRVTKDGLSVPFDTQKIMSGPEVSAERHMSAAQTDQLSRHFGLSVPAQGGDPDAGTRSRQTQPGETRPGETRPGETRPGETRPGETRPGETQAETQRGEAQRGAAQPDEEWLIRAEERVDVGTEMLESGRARLHKYVDVEPVEQAVHVFHEEYEIERVPITPEERVRGVIAEAEQEIILHEERPVFRKETVPVERVRLVAKRVEEDRTLRDEIRKERVEVEGNSGMRTPESAESAGQNRPRR